MQYDLTSTSTTAGGSNPGSSDQWWYRRWWQRRRRRTRGGLGDPRPARRARLASPRSSPTSSSRRGPGVGIGSRRSFLRNDWPFPSVSNGALGDISASRRPPGRLPVVVFRPMSTCSGQPVTPSHARRDDPPRVATMLRVVIRRAVWFRGSRPLLPGRSCCSGRVGKHPLGRSRSTSSARSSSVHTARARRPRRTVTRRDGSA